MPDLNASTGFAAIGNSTVLGAALALAHAHSVDAVLTSNDSIQRRVIERGLVVLGDRDAPECLALACAALEAAPILTKSVTSGALYGVGDCIAQAVSRRQAGTADAPFDMPRLMRAVIFGGVLVFWMQVRGPRPPGIASYSPPTPKTRAGGLRHARGRLRQQEEHEEHPLSLIHI